MDEFRKRRRWAAIAVVIIAGLISAAVLGKKLSPYKPKKVEYVRASKEQAVCGLMRKKTLEAITNCRDDEARNLGLMKYQCRAYYKHIAYLCDKYAQTKWDGEFNFKSCLMNDDRLTKCTFVLARGCEYTPELAAEVEKTTLGKDPVGFERSVKKSCGSGDPRRNLKLAVEGNLKVLAKEVE